jgi:hypothetical protein
MSQTTDVGLEIPDSAPPEQPLPGPDPGGPTVPDPVPPEQPAEAPLGPDLPDPEPPREPDPEPPDVPSPDPRGPETRHAREQAQTTPLGHRGTDEQRAYERAEDEE